MAKCKRSNGEGSVLKLKSGKWRGQLMDGFKSDVKKNIVSFTADTKAEVLDQMREYRNARERMNITDGRNLTFHDWAETWYRDHESQIQPSTYAGYRYTLNRLEEHFRGKLLGEIKVVHINRYFDLLPPHLHLQPGAGGCANGADCPHCRPRQNRDHRRVSACGRPDAGAGSGGAQPKD